MDINEFMAKTKPARSASSILTAYRKDLLRLQSAGYSLSQLRSYLAANGVMVSASWIAAYLAHPAKKRQRQPPAPENPVMEPGQPQPAPENPIVEDAGAGITSAGKSDTTNNR